MLSCRRCVFTAFVAAQVVSGRSPLVAAEKASGESAASPAARAIVLANELVERRDRRVLTKRDYRRRPSPAPSSAQKKANKRRLNRGLPGVLWDPGFETVESVDSPPQAAEPLDERTRSVRRNMWLSRDEIARLPIRGLAWEHLLKAAYSQWGMPNLSNQNHDHNTLVLAGALAAVRLEDDALAAKVRAHVRAIPRTEEGGTTLALGRNLHAYVIAAGLVDLNDPEFDRWLSNVRHWNLKGKTLISTHEVRPNNWGTHAGASRIAAAIYLCDTDDLNRAAKVFAGWLGDRNAYAGFRFKDLSWQADPSQPVGVNPVGANKEGHSIDGVLPDDMRRGGSFRWPPTPTNYPWAALNGTVIQAELLHRQGFDAWNWSDQAIRRSVAFLESVGWYVDGEDEEWLVHLVNKRYETTFRAPQVARTGKSFGWTDWTHATPAE